MIKAVAAWLTVGLALLLAPSAAWAQQGWPNRPVQIIVPFAAGASGNVLGIVFAGLVLWNFRGGIVRPDCIFRFGLVGYRAECG